MPQPIQYIGVARNDSGDCMRDLESAKVDVPKDSAVPGATSVVLCSGAARGSDVAYRWPAGCDCLGVGSTLLLRILRYRAVH